MTWIDTAAKLRDEQVPAVLVTLAAVRGHAPRDAGAKFIVTAEEFYGTIGGGNLERTATTRARELLAEHATEPEMLTLHLNDRAPVKYGKQCCGGEVTILFEPLTVPATVAVFGIGNIGLEIARILGRQNLRLELSDSRQDYLAQLDKLEKPVARINRHHSVAGEQVISKLPAGAHVLIMTHDHAEDLMLCDAALRHKELASIGLIGSNAKWQRFRKKLLAEGHAAEDIDTIDCPIGLPDLPGKHPATIAVSVAAELLRRMA
jgi:xanthine dehydrogenase accessory factor